MIAEADEVENEDDARTWTLTCKCGEEVCVDPEEIAEMLNCAPPCSRAIALVCPACKGSVLLPAEMVVAIEDSRRRPVTFTDEQRNDEVLRLRYAVEHIESVGKITEGMARAAYLHMLEVKYRRGSLVPYALYGLGWVVSTLAGAQWGVWWPLVAMMIVSQTIRFAAVVYKPVPPKAPS